MEQRTKIIHLTLMYVHHFFGFEDGFSSHPPPPKKNPKFSSLLFACAVRNVDGDFHFILFFLPKMWPHSAMNMASWRE